MKYINEYLDHQRSLIEESFSSMLAEGKRWPDDYVKSALNKLVIRYGLEDPAQVQLARQLVIDMKNALSFAKHNNKMHFFLDKVATWICQNVSQFNDVRMFIIKNIGLIADGFEAMAASERPEWSTEAVKSMTLMQFMLNAEEALQNAKIDADPAGKTYEVVPIASYSQMNRLYGGSCTGGRSGEDGWCHANGIDMYNDFTDDCQNKMYVIAQDGWQGIHPPESPSTAYDEYGMSLIAIAVDIDSGELVDETLRWNHAKKPSNGKCDNAFNDDWNDLNDAVGFDVKSEVDIDLAGERKARAARNADPDAYASRIMRRMSVVDSSAIPEDIRGKISHIEVPANVTAIGDNAFSYCTSLKSIVLPESLMSIGKHAFFWCTSLADIKLPAKLQSIGDAAFCRCYALKNVSVPAQTRRIGMYAFNMCQSLENAEVLGDSCGIGEGAFNNCRSLKRVSFKAMSLDQLKMMRAWPFGLNTSIIDASSSR